MLRASDLLPLRVFDITDHNGDVVQESTIRQKKTGHGHVVALSPETRNSIADWLLASEKNKNPEVHVWTSIGNRRTGRPVTREQYANLVKSWSYLARIDPKRHSPHSMRDERWHGGHSLNGHILDGPPKAKATTPEDGNRVSAPIALLFPNAEHSQDRPPPRDGFVSSEKPCLFEASYGVLALFSAKPFHADMV
jgi:hypothetical protein